MVWTIQNIAAVMCTALARYVVPQVDIITDFVDIVARSNGNTYLYTMAVSDMTGIARMISHRLVTR